MKILLANKYFFIKGGVEQVFFDTAKILEDHGHRIISFSMKHPRNFPSEYEQYFASNVDYQRSGLGNLIKSTTNLLYSFEARNKIEQLIEKDKPDIAHLHSIYHQISPSIIHSLKKKSIPVVMTLHDYKSVCASYLLLAKGEICEACKGSKYYHCFLKKCVKNSRLKSSLNTAEMYLHHKLLHIYNLVDIFISPSRFLKVKIEEMGFKGKIIYLSNFVNLKYYQPTHGFQEKSIVYVGRLSEEKGVDTFIDAAKDLNLKFKIIGEGPMKESLSQKVRSQNIRNVEFLGYRTGTDLQEEMKKSMFTVLPSKCYENNPRIVMEAFALAKPVVGSRIGGIPELVKDNDTGLTFQSGNANDLRSKIEYLLNNPDKIFEMGKNARDFAEKELNAGKHYKKLMEIYELAKKFNGEKVKG
jgi:glycosyltransferase involved in cell wall biosynthesis